MACDLGAKIGVSGLNVEMSCGRVQKRKFQWEWKWCAPPFPAALEPYQYPLSPSVPSVVTILDKSWGLAHSSHFDP